MGGVINLIKKLFSGIFSLIGGILGGKSGYFMELDEADSPKPALAKAPKNAEIETAKTAVAATVTKAKSVVESVVEDVKDAAKEGTATIAKSAKAESKKAEPVKAEPVKAELVETHNSTNGSKPQVVADTLNLPQPTVSFATEYLVPKPTNTRRRPGANMGAFLEMAKTAKTPNN